MKTKIVLNCLFTVIVSCGVFAGNPINIPVKVSELFHHSFPGVKNETWYKIQNSYEASFKNSDSSLCKVFYSRNRKLLYIFKYSSGNDLPLFIKTKLAENYPDKKVFSVTEVYADDETSYHIILEDNQKLYEVNSNANGDLTVSKTFIKAR